MILNLLRVEDLKVGVNALQEDWVSGASSTAQSGGSACGGGSAGTARLPALEAGVRTRPMPACWSWHDTTFTDTRTSIGCTITERLTPPISLASKVEGMSKRPFAECHAAGCS